MFALIPAIVVTILSGAGLSLQAACMAAMGEAISPSFSAVMAYVVGLGPILIYFLIDLNIGKVRMKELPARIKSTKWWAWFGGLFGSFFIFFNILSVPVLGVSTFTAYIVSFQILSAVILDHFGWVGLDKRRITIWRGIGCMTMIGSVLLITLL